MSDKKYNATSIILQITLSLTFISIFFFTYTTTIEKEIITTQVDTLVGDLTNNLNIVLTDDQKKEVQTVFKNLQPDMSSLEETDREASENNKKLIKESAIILGCAFLLGIILTIYLSIVYKLKVKWVLKNSIAGVICVVLVEYLFLTFYVSKYKIASQNKIIYNIIDTLQQYSNQPNDSIDELVLPITDVIPIPISDPTIPVIEDSEIEIKTEPDSFDLEKSKKAFIIAGYVMIITSVVLLLYTEIKR